ncbi:TonB-dependent receptor domain-containing protein [Tritonibacter scottomollicae]|uniref:Hemoglobin/transferrin/lactoferrin receptor protein n=1 Tax=Tritonibacter scottomollicae TaxID=483013 RepID=A0A2T1AGD0_TRISK|nr:TonB-dependent receptor [Tritonibacter scottomollicae]PRZ47655.1 hemoglobin/transferrin/lactoferrin receptor protein [Tritonibacter scottomollicae]
MKINKMRRALLCSASGMALAVTATVSAAQDLDDGDGFLGLLVLGNNKRDVQTDTATPETVINAEEIQDRQAGSVAELIDSVPGVTLVNAGTPTGAGINIRGYGADGTYGSNQKVQIQLDGATMGSEELYRIGTQLYTDPALFREVSVIRGTVGSYEYGSGVIGGVVNLQTIDAADLTEGEIGLSGRQTFEYYGNANTSVSSTILGWQPTENLEFLLNYTYREQGNYTDGDGNEVANTGYELPSYLVKGRYSFGDNANQSLTFSHSQTTSDEKDVPYDAFASIPFGNVDRYTETTTTSLQYAYNPLGNDLVDLTATLSYADQYIEQDEVGSTGSGLLNADHRYETTKLTVKNTSLFNAFGAEHNLRAGGEIIHKERLDASSAPGGTDKRFALFAIDEIDFGNGFSLTPAMRYETQDIRSSSDGSYVTAGESFDNSELMGGISARYAFDSGFAVFGSVAYTAGLPILDDFDYATYATYMTQSEKAVTYELGASYDKVGVFSGDDTLRAKVNLWQTRLWDYTSGTDYASVDRVNTEGVEIEASYSHGSGAYVDMNANMSSGEWSYVDGTTADYTRMPANSLGLTVGKKFNDTLDLSWEAVLTKDIRSTPGYAVHNLRATYAIDTGFLKEAELRLGVENIFDKQYTPHLATRAASGRNIKLSLAAAF